MQEVLVQEHLHQEVYNLQVDIILGVIKNS